jgi:hypothetical protein
MNLAQSEGGHSLPDFLSDICVSAPLWRFLNTTCDAAWEKEKAENLPVVDLPPWYVPLSAYGVTHVRVKPEFGNHWQVAYLV